MCDNNLAHEIVNLFSKKIIIHYQYQISELRNLCGLSFLDPKLGMVESKN